MSEFTLHLCPNCGQGQPEIIKPQSSAWQQAFISCPVCGYWKEVKKFVNEVLSENFPNPKDFTLLSSWEMTGFEFGELVLVVTVITQVEIDAYKSILDQLHPMVAKIKVTNPKPESIYCMVCGNPTLEPTPNREFMACNSGHYEIKMGDYVIQYLSRLGFLGKSDDEKTIYVVANRDQLVEWHFGLTTRRLEIFPVANIWIGHNKQNAVVLLLSKPNGFAPLIYQNLLNSMKSHFKAGFEILEKKE